MKKSIIFILSLTALVSCSDKSNIDYRMVPFIEMTVDSLSRYAPDSFLNTGNISATKINITRIINEEAQYEDVYAFDYAYGFLKEMRLYSNGDYYVTEYGFKKTELVSEVEYIDNAEKNILHSYSFAYDYKNNTVKVLDKDIVRRSYKFIFEEDKKIIQEYDNNNDLLYEYTYLYDNDKLVSISSRRPHVYSILATKLNYLNYRLNNIEIYSDSIDVQRLWSKKEYEYDEEGRLTGLTQTNHIYTGELEVHKTAFKEHDSHGNWIESEYNDINGNNIVYKREIFY
jgi:hypothetical protein